MENNWSLDWIIQYQDCQYTWRELTPTARLRIRLEEVRIPAD